MDSRYYDEPGTFAAEDVPTADTDESTQDALAEQEIPFDGQLRPLPDDDELRAFLYEDADEATIRTEKAMARGAESAATSLFFQTGHIEYLDAMIRHAARAFALEGLLTEREVVRG